MVYRRRAMTVKPVFLKLQAKLVPMLCYDCSTVLATAALMLRYDRSTVPAIAYTGTAMTSPGSALNA